MEREFVNGFADASHHGEVTADMDQAKEFHNLDDTSNGLFRELGPGVTTRIFSGEQAMLSVVSLAPAPKVFCTITPKSSGAYFWQALRCASRMVRRYP
jgi:hypothetical protein